MMILFISAVVASERRVNVVGGIGSACAALLGDPGVSSLVVVHI